MINYCIPVCNEHIELKRLLTQIERFLKDGDRVIVQGDQGNVTDDVVSVISPYIKKDYFKYIEYPLNKDFAAFKNNFIHNVDNGWIFQIDADELVSETFLSNIHWILEHNDHIDGFSLPRINIVHGLTQDWVNTWGWNISRGVVSVDDEPTISILSKYGIDATKDTLRLVNFPDYQSRLFKLSKGIYWEGKVHERLTSTEPCTINLPLPCTIESVNQIDYDYCLFHVKDISRQIKQNELYDNL